jgi:hypothetical protein
MRVGRRRKVAQTFGMKTAKSTEFINTQSGHHLKALAGMQRVGDKPCDRETEINCSETFDATEKITYLTIYYSASGCASSDVFVRSESESSLLLLSTENSLLLLSVQMLIRQQYMFSR